MSDSIYAGITALMLLGAAAFIAFVVHPGGFEGSVGWLFGLLPGALLAAILVAPLAKSSPSFSSGLLWPLILWISFLWYFAVSYALIKSYRLASPRFNRRCEKLRKLFQDEHAD
jgi:hypothetical protein